MQPKKKINRECQFFGGQGQTSPTAAAAHLHLLGVLRQVVLPLSGLLHQPSVLALLYLLLVLKRGHLLRLVLHLPVGHE